MRAVVQRVRTSSVTVDQVKIGAIDAGLTVLVGIEPNDTQKDIEFIANKITNLRIFEDDEGKMNRSVKEIGGSILLVSQFTLYGDARKGNRPSFIRAAGYDSGKEIYERLCDSITQNGIVLQTGEYGADMLLSIENDGPVTILLDSEKTF